MTNRPFWGLLPEQVLADIRRVEWDNLRNLKDLMLRKRPFPREYSLKPPNGVQAGSDIGHLETYVARWKAYVQQAYVVWEDIPMRHFSTQRLPVALKIPSFTGLLEVLGREARERASHWEAVITPLITLDRSLLTPLVNQLLQVEQLSVTDAECLAQVLPQLQRGMGRHRYIRAIPLIGVDTKFIETYQTLLQSLLDHQLGGEISGNGGLLAWLDCLPLPNNWITLIPLCEKSKGYYGGLGELQVTSEHLVRAGVPAGRILIVENYQSGYALPSLEDTISIVGCGKNLAWMTNDWLAQRQVGYWGDIDSAGLEMLNDARRQCPCVQALMMDAATVETHRQRMAKEGVSLARTLSYLLPDERALYLALRDGRYPGTRLEQERLSQDYIEMSLRKWCCAKG